MGPRDIHVFLPADYASGSETYRVMYFNDGEGVFGGLDQSRGVYSDVDYTHDQLLGERLIHPAILIRVANAKGVVNGRGTDLVLRWTPESRGRAEEYYTFLATRLKRYVDARFRTKPEARFTGIAGNSLGGLAAFYFGYRHPDLFLFAAAGLDAARLDILSDEFLERVSALEQKNLALETLRKLLNDQIKITERTNLVQAQKFREALEKAMVGYTNKQISTAQMIAQLLELAKWVRDAKRHGEGLGLNNEETAFYDALAENGSAKDVMKSDQLRLMARALAEMVRKMPKLDWTQRESVRADLRRKVRRLLAMYGYPPDLSEDATQLVLKQAELSTEYAK